jgi:hypothetical protein
MAIYELRTYGVIVGKMSEVVELYRNEGWPAASKYGDKLVGYFTGDVGAMNQLVHLWKFDDDADRRAFWKARYRMPSTQIMPLGLGPSPPQPT